VMLECRMAYGTTLGKLAAAKARSNGRE